MRVRFARGRRARPLESLRAQSQPRRSAPLGALSRFGAARSRTIAETPQKNRVLVICMYILVAHRYYVLSIIYWYVGRMGCNTWGTMGSVREEREFGLF